MSKLFLNVNGKMTELGSPIGVEPSFSVAERKTDNFQNVKDSMEVSFSAKIEEMVGFFEQMKKELSTVDITYWPAQMIERLISTFPDISKLVTHDVDHYQMLQTEDGYTCVAGDYDKMFGVPLILDKKKKIKAAHVEFEKKGGGNDE